MVDRSWSTKLVLAKAVAAAVVVVVVEAVTAVVVAVATNPEQISWTFELSIGNISCHTAAVDQ